MRGERARRLLEGTRFPDVRWVDTIDSTNAALLAEARAGAPEGRVVVADAQTAGRGRLGRTWESPAGSSLLMSVLLRPNGLVPPMPLRSSHLITAAVALAAAAACEAHAGVQPLLKWPNDLLIDGRKLGGVLAESVLSTTGDGLDTAVVGIGLNLNWPQPTTVPEPMRALVPTLVSLNWVAGRAVSREDLLVTLLRGVEERYARLGTEAGRAAVAGEYRAMLVTLGQRVRVELPRGGDMTGQALDVTIDGHLMVVGDDGREHEIAAGDVLHLRSAPTSGADEVAGMG